MTATEELRRMLDERGVEWEDMSIRPYACTSWRDPDGEPCTALEGADDIPNGKLSVQALLTPEQAIVATLGRGTCRDKNRRFNTWECSECGATVLLMFDDFGEPSYCVDGVADVPRYCPNCGRRVVEQ